VDQPPRERVTSHAAGQRFNGKALARGGQHQVAEPAAAQHRRVGDHAGVRED
jgi:hypothetical protein